MEIYQYAPLSTKMSIRLLSIEPGNPEESLYCSIQEVSLNDNPSYLELSYTWGDLHDRCTIYIEDPSVDEEDDIEYKHRRIGITTNLQAVLLIFEISMIRSSSGRDAICIDQANVAERSEQVKLMPRIYELATRSEEQLSAIRQTFSNLDSGKW
jgi:hypothetical protein